MWALTFVILNKSNYRLQSQWQESCERSNLQIPSRANVEFKKRIKQSTKSHDKGKAKLNLSKCDLDDQLVHFASTFRIYKSGPLFLIMMYPSSFCTSEYLISILYYFIFSMIFNIPLSPTPLTTSLNFIIFFHIYIIHS